MKKALVWALPLVLVSFSLVVAEEKGDDGWKSLFDGKTLEGWKASERPEQWKVVDGAIVAHGERSHLFYMDDEFEDFHLKADIMTLPGSNSGLYVCTKFQDGGWPEVGYETQVNNTQGDPVKTGSLYNVVKIFQANAQDNKWWTQEVIVRGKSIRVLVDGKVLYEYVEPDGVTGTRKLGKGTFALQAHDPGSTAMYKNIMVKKLEKEDR